MAEKRFFDPDRVAHLETEGWRAYYEHKWLRLLRLVATLSQEQFSIGFPRSWQAAYYVTRASAAWAPEDHDLDLVWSYLHRYYRMAQQASGLLFDPAVVAKLEVNYYIAHRNAAGSDDKTELLNALIDLHMALFRVPEVVARGSAQWRVRALNTVDLITSGQSANVREDWKKVESDLQRCYKGIHALLTSV
jgi:hypothetical protein